MNKQIEEMALDIHSVSHLPLELCGALATDLVDKGYREQIEAKWVICGMFDDFFKCSHCGDDHPWQTAIEYKFCPNCGARMKGENE